MPHADNSDQSLPKTPPRKQAPIPKSESQSGASAKAKIGMLPVISIANYEPDPTQVDRALGVEDTEVPFGDPTDMRFRQPQFGR